MKDWLAFFACALIAGWILTAGTLALLRLRYRPTRRIYWPAIPSGQGLRALTGLLIATGSSTYSRDRLQERLRILAEDLSALARDAEGDSWQKDALLSAYFTEDHVGFKGSARRKQALDPDFLRRTEEVIVQLERRGNAQQGDSP